MNLNDSINLVSQLKNQYKAFDRLEEFLVEVQRLDSALRGMEGKKNALATEIADFINRRDDEAKETESFTAEQNAIRERVRNKVNAEIAEFRKESQDTKDALEAKVVSLRESKDKLVSEHAALKTKLDAEIESRQNTLKNLEALIEETRARLKSIA